ncbi:sigma-54-dependent Fis family transcriptional regulator [Aeribacillus alveayuensis]|uniref:Transcriptional regulator with PAS, ATPase and Fis domain n=1 Tax=Aeribacillus alveayuensis TaxID=279215 RepID=A0ABT9VNI3_9BACI|nr:transcriptional regulator with PAS, ATPase and Fis domain [Bacillus alveayuensis]
MTKMLVIAPYEGLGELFEEAANELEMDIDVRVGNLYKGLMIAKSLESEGYDVVISRGATARVIKEKIHLPVVELQISGYDILRTLRLIQGYTGKVGVMSFFNIVKGAESVGLLLGIDVQSFLINSEEDIKPTIYQAKAQGIDLIIGDVITTNVAKHHGINSMLITSGKEAVFDAIERAKELVYYLDKEKKIKNSYHAVVEKSKAGIIIVDQDANCIEINEQAAKFLDVDRSEMLNQQLVDDFPFINFKKVMHSHKEESYQSVLIGDHVLDIEKFPIFHHGHLQGAAIILRKSNEVMMNGNGKNFSAMYRPVLQFSHLVVHSEQMKKVVSASKQISQSNLPVLIIGEKGTGKTAIAQAIHLESKRRNKPFYLLNCQDYSEEELETLLFGKSMNNSNIFEIVNGGTICFDNIRAIPYHLQDKLAEQLEKKKIIFFEEEVEFDIRILVTTCENLAEQVDKGELSPKLYNTIHSYTLKLPPLRKRKEDMEDLIRSFIATVNAKLGKQIAGLSDEVLHELYEYDWPGNVAQLEKVVQQMCLASDGPFIVMDDVISIIKGLKTKPNENNGIHVSLDNKTLDELVNEIILKVIEDEEYNQSKAAKRLGINRSTLWRKLKTLK